MQVASCGSHQCQLYHFFFLSSLSPFQFSPPRREHCASAEQPSATTPTGGAAGLGLTGTPPSSPLPPPPRKTTASAGAQKRWTGQRQMSRWWRSSATRIKRRRPARVPLLHHPPPPWASSCRRRRMGRRIRRGSRSD